MSMSKSLWMLRIILLCDERPMFCAKLRQTLLPSDERTKSLRMWGISVPWDEIFEAPILRTAQLWDGRYVFLKLRQTALLI